MRLVVLTPPWIRPGFFDQVAEREGAQKQSLRQLETADTGSAAAAGPSHGKAVAQFASVPRSITTGLCSAENFQAAEALLESDAHVLVLYSSPAEALARAALQNASPDEALEVWCGEAERLLKLFRHDRRRCVLIDADQAVAAPDDFKYFCADRFGWTPDAPEPTSDPARLSSHVVAAMTMALVAKAPRARSLVEELAASGQHFVDLSRSTDFGAAFQEFNALLADRRKALRAEETIARLRAHLHLVQSQLEARFYEAELKSVAAVEKRYAAVRAQKDALAAEIAALKSSTSWKLTAPLRAILIFWRERVISRFRNGKMAALVRRSALFDAVWYKAQYKDVASTGLDPALHYVKFGAAEGRSPGPQFNGAAYLAANPDIAQLGLNPLVHYIQHGKTEGRPLSRPTRGARKSAVL